MGGNDFSTSIILDYNNGKKEITKRSKYKNFIDEECYEVVDELDDKSIMRFLNTDINSIK